MNNNNVDVQEVKKQAKEQEGKVVILKPGDKKHNNFSNTNDDEFTDYQEIE